jgi:hypothetical protein
VDIRLASPPRSFTRRPRDASGIRQIQWHATRGATSMDRQVSATESWFASPANNRGGWGGSADFVVGPDHRVGGRVVIVQFEDPWNSFGSWSAIEVAQPAGRDRLGNYTGAADANFEQYTEETIDACLWLVGHINGTLVARGIEPVPPVWIDEWDQARGQPVPRGHIGHEDLANGKKLGKHDPGHLFPRGAMMASLIRPPTPDLANLDRLMSDVRTSVAALDAAIAHEARGVLDGD